MDLPINIAVIVEDGLQEAICERLLSSFGEKFNIEGKIERHRHSKSGLEKNAESYNLAAAGGNVRLVLMDMDSLAYPQNKRKCPDSEIKKMLRSTKDDKLLLRFAVWEAESWLLADWQNLKQFFRLKNEDSPYDPDNLPDAKERLHDLIRAGSNKKCKEKWLYDFTREKWNPQKAAKHSKSLRRTLKRLKSFPNP